jgi:outer membrane protein TolC
VTRDVNLDGLERDAMNVCKVAPTIDQRADIVAQQKKLEAASSNVTDQDLAFVPTLTAQSTIGTTTVPTGFAPSTTWNIQGVLSIPIWDGGVRYGNTRTARAQEDEALTQLESMRRQAVVQVEQARRGVQVAESSAKVATSARDLAVETDRLTMLGYQVGQGTSLDLVLAATARRQSEVNLALQEFGVVKARILAVLSLASCQW